jgi:Domain of Unknown Function (DUF349)
MSQSDQNPAAEKPTSREENSASVENTDDLETKLSTGDDTGMPAPEVLSDVTEINSTSVPEVMHENVLAETEIIPAGETDEVIEEQPFIHEVPVTQEAEVPEMEEKPVAADAELPILDEDMVTPVAEIPLLDEGPVAEVLVLNEEPAASVAEVPVMVEEPRAEANIVPEATSVKPANISVMAESDDEEEEIAEAIIAEEGIAEGDYEKYSREQLVTLLESAVQEADINAVKSQISLIKVAFLQVSKEAKHEMYQQLSVAEGETVEFETAPDPLDERFKAAFAIYKQKKGKFNEELDKQKLVNLAAKSRILEELKALINSEETLKKTYDDFKVLQERWRQIGMVPKGDANGLWQNYHFLVEKFFDKVKINKELKDLDLKKNLEHKIEICEKAEELLLESSLLKAFKQLQQYHEDWKEIGPVPQEKRDEIWDRFRNATDKINERRREHYSHVEDEQEANYKAKTILCDKAEQVVAREYKSMKEWQDSTNTVNELLKDWKTIGTAPKKQNNEIWIRFKTSLDAYFNAKKEYFNKLKDQHTHNYNVKLDLCMQAESMRLSNDWKNTTRELINLQNTWKNVGPVPRKYADKIWKRFRSACDDFFKNKAEFFKNIHGVEDENLQKKIDMLKRVSELEPGTDKQSSLTVLKEIQREWMEIGHVPIKDKERLQNEFRSAMNKHYDKLKIDASEIQTMNYRSRLENIKEQPDANRIITKERASLQNRITALQEEIKLWENNIGFFASSKQANILKSEFEAKIAKAKDELTLLEAKMKFLRKSMEA